MNLSDKQIRRLQKFILENRLTSGNKLIAKLQCFNCKKMIDEKKEYIDIIKRNGIVKNNTLYPSRIQFHSECWLSTAGEEFEIK